MPRGEMSDQVDSRRNARHYGAAARGGFPVACSKSAKHAPPTTQQLDLGCGVGYTVIHVPRMISDGCVVMNVLDAWLNKARW